MNAHKFDELTKNMARTTNRRNAAKAFGIGALALLLGGKTVLADDATPPAPYDPSQPDKYNGDCTGSGCTPGNANVGDGQVITTTYLEQGMTGKGERVLWPKKVVPQGYDLVVEGVIVRINGVTLSNDGAVVWEPTGTYDIDITDGAYAIVRDENAKDEVCTRYVSNIRRGDAMTALFVPKGHETDCGVKNAKTGSSTQPQAKSGSGSGGNAASTGGTPMASTGDTVDGQPRCDTTCGGDPQAFKKGDAVLGYAVTFNDGSPGCDGGGCYYSKAPADGMVHGGVVHPWKQEVKNFTDKSAN
jgi:hypothetical protein